MTDNNQNDLNDVQSIYPSESLNDTVDNEAEVESTDLDEIAEQMTEESESADGDEVSLNSIEEDDGDRMNADAENLVGDVDEGTE